MSATSSMTSGASPPVAMIVTESGSAGASSAAIRRAIPSICPANPKMIPDCSASTVFLPMTRSGPGQLHLQQLRGPARQRVDRDLDPRRQRPADELAPRAHRVEVGRRAEVDHDRPARRTGARRRRVFMIRSLPTSFGLSFRTGTPVLHARLDDHRGHVAVVAAHHLPHLVQHRRHGRAQRDAGHARVGDQRALRQQPCSDHRELVGGPDRVGRDPPVLDDLVPVEDARAPCWCCRRQWSAALLVPCFRYTGFAARATAPGPVCTGTLSISRVAPTFTAASSSAAPA